MMSVSFLNPEEGIGPSRFRYSTLPVTIVILKAATAQNRPTSGPASAITIDFPSSEIT